MLSDCCIVWALLICMIGRYHSRHDIIHISFPWYTSKVGRSRDGVGSYGLTHALVTALRGWRGGEGFNAWILRTSWQQSCVLVLWNLFTEICFPWPTHDSSPWMKASKQSKHIDMMDNWNRAGYWQISQTDSCSGNIQLMNMRCKKPSLVLQVDIWGGYDCLI